MSNLVEGGHCFFKFFKGGHLQKRLGNPDLQNNEWQKVEEILIKNSFPTEFIDYQIQNKNTFESEQTENTDDKKD